jgi:hypothetical protein
MKDIFVGFTMIVLLFSFLFITYNGVVYLTCLSSEGTPYFNKIVYACHFNDTVFTQQVLHSEVSSDCYLNGVKTNCSDEVLNGLQVWGHYQGYTSNP